MRRRRPRAVEGLVPFLPQFCNSPRPLKNGSRVLCYRVWYISLPTASCFALEDTSIEPSLEIQLISGCKFACASGTPVELQPLDPSIRKWWRSGVVCVVFLLFAGLGFGPSLSLRSSPFLPAPLRPSPCKTSSQYTAGSLIVSLQSRGRRFFRTELTSAFSTSACACQSSNKLLKKHCNEYFQYFFEIQGCTRRDESQVGAKAAGQQRI